MIFQVVGRTTHLLAAMTVGDILTHLVGPLGRPTHIAKFGTVVCVGGGIGVAPLHPIAQAMKAAGNHTIVIMGARNRDLLILEPEMRRIAEFLGQFRSCRDQLARITREVQSRGQAGRGGRLAGFSGLTRCAG